MRNDDNPFMSGEMEGVPNEGRYKPPYVLDTGVKQAGTPRIASPQKRPSWLDRISDWVYKVIRDILLRFR